MHVHSLMPILGLSLIPLSSALPGLQHPHPKRDLQVSDQLATAWSYAGCYTDTPASRGLSLDGYTDDSLTEAKCIAYCDRKGYSRAGVEFGKECFCGYEVQSPSILTSESQCNFACPGATSEPCGGYGYMNVFTNSVAPPKENLGPDGWQSLGCYTDSVSSRILSVFKPANDGIAFVYGCTNTCQREGYRYAGLENGNECFCGNEILGPGAPAVSGCNKACTGDRNELCGGPNRLNLYQATSPVTTTNTASTPSSSATSSGSVTTSTCNVTPHVPPYCDEGAYYSYDDPLVAYFQQSCDRSIDSNAPRDTLLNTASNRACQSLCARKDNCTVAAFDEPANVCYHYDGEVTLTGRGNFDVARRSLRNPCA